MRKFFFITLILSFQISHAETLPQFEVESFVGLLSQEEIHASIGDYPKLGSARSLNDMAVLMKYQFSRTKADCEVAQTFADVKIDPITVLFTTHNGPITKAEARRVYMKLGKTMLQTVRNALKAKEMYDRPRPYLSNPLIKPCVDLEKTTAYPSGHAMLGRVLGAALARIYPDRAEALMKRGNYVGESRVIGGVHHPTDIEAGFKLADLLIEDLVNSDAFKDALVELK